MLFILVVIGISLIEIIGKYKLFLKANKKGWYSLIPIYNDYVLVQIAEVRWWFLIILIFTRISMILSFISIDETLFFNIFDIISNLIYFLTLYCINYNISTKCNKNYIYALGLTFLPFIFYPLISKEKFNNKKNVLPFGVV